MIKEFNMYSINKLRRHLTNVMLSTMLKSKYLVKYENFL